MKKILTVILLACCFLTLTVLPSFAAESREELTRLLSENYDASLYTVESYLEYQAALSSALAVYENPVATEEDISNAVYSLTDARDRLVFRHAVAALPDCIEEIDEILNTLDLSVSKEMDGKLRQMKAEIQDMILQNTATAEEISEKVSACNTLLILARKELDDIREYSDYGSNEGVVVPTDYVPPAKEIGNVTRIRLVLFWVGLGLALAGIVTAAIYFSKARKQN